MLPPPYPAQLGSIISRTTAETEDDPTMEIILQTESWALQRKETSVKSKEQKLEDSNFEKKQPVSPRVIFSIIVFLIQNELSKIISCEAVGQYLIFQTT